VFAVFQDSDLLVCFSFFALTLKHSTGLDGMGSYAFCIAGGAVGQPIGF
jgi:hypothetical protein